MDDLVSHADAYFAEQNLAEAIKGYGRILDLQPQNLHALHCAGLACFLDNKPERAREFMGRAALAAPDRVDILEQNGLLAALANDGAQAEAYYRRALYLGGSAASLHRNLGDCLRQSGRLAEAKEQYQLAISIEPGLHHAIRAVARISTELGESDDAADYWLRAWALDPSALQDGLDLVAALAKVKRVARLDETVKQIRTRQAVNADALEALCLVLYRIDRFGDMLSVACQGLDIDPHRAVLHHYAAHSLSVRGRILEAMGHSREAVRLTPDDPTMQSQLANLELSQGDYKNGWQRRKTYYTTALARHTLVFPSFPEWNGEPIAGCSFLLVGEQGRGDEIQFIRFAEWLYQQGAIVDLLVSEPIARIAASVKGVRSVLTSKPPGPYDYWSHMLRMPEHMKLDLPMLPIVMQYIAASQNKIDHWQVQIDAVSPLGTQERNRRIGVVWAGGPYTALDRFRSINIEALRPLFSHPGTTWFSVQKGERERDSEALADEFDLHTLGPTIGDFTDTLAILETLDLLITVDTSVAHLAGAANLPVWVLLPAYSEWRWLTGRTDSPWYPSMRLFRQRELGEWKPVVEEVRDALWDWCGDS
ncbi:tetratricopeptide repeat protein [Paraburkholderia sediminicola]|uniref:tetratricopeptide repeat protein n=1 Tax=Paraburkholderia sediminicola TaxID=458836 RepID=UPI0038BD4326